MKRNTLVGPQLHQGGANRFQVSAARALWLLVPILIGAGAATQTLADLLNYHSSLGPNLFHFYPPGPISCGPICGGTPILPFLPRPLVWA